MNDFGIQNKWGRSLDVKRLLNRPIQSYEYGLIIVIIGIIAVVMYKLLNNSSDSTVQQRQRTIKRPKRIRENYTNAFDRPSDVDDEVGLQRALYGNASDGTGLCVPESTPPLSAHRLTRCWNVTLNKEDGAGCMGERPIDELTIPVPRVCAQYEWQSTPWAALKPDPADPNLVWKQCITNPSTLKSNICV
jgi:hypothetical protein